MGQGTLAGIPIRSGDNGITIKNELGLMTEPKNPKVPSEEVGLHRLLTRLDKQCQQADFQAQRQMALGLALEPYLAPLTAHTLSPLEEEIQLAQWYLFADYFPTDGHPSLIEQVRDNITEHIPQEERIWLDPVRHSYMDILTIVDTDPATHPNGLQLQSLGDKQQFRVFHPITPALQKNRVLLTRLIRGATATYLPGPPLVLSRAMGDALLSFVHELRRQIEFGTGNFALSEWPEFTKQYGYLLIWSLARIRGGAMAVADAQVTYWTETGKPFFYAIALYEHHEFRNLAEGLDQWEGWTAHPPKIGSSEKSGVRVWTLGISESDATTSYAVASITLTSTQLIVEADSAGRLDSLKHELAATFGFSLHFKGDTATPPPHSPPQVDLLADRYIAPPVTVSTEEEVKMLSSFLEKVYLEWAEQPCPAFNNETPRHFAREPQPRQEVAALIDQMEQQDLGFRRTGHRAYDYGILRSHIGL